MPFVRELGVPAGTSPGGRAPVWDGRDASGLLVARGVYYLALEDMNHRVSGRIVRAQ